MANNGTEASPREGGSALSYGEQAWAAHPLFDMDDFHRGFFIGGTEVSYALLAAELAPKGQTVEQFFHIPQTPDAPIVELVSLPAYPDEADALHPIAS